MVNKKTDAQWLKEARQACEGEPYEVIKVYGKEEVRQRYVWASVYCERHYLTFEVRAFSLIRDGSRCKRCGYEEQSKKVSKTLQDFIDYLGGDPPGDFDYLGVSREMSKVYLKVECLDCEHIFKRVPGDHKRSKGCPECSKGSKSSGHLLVREALETLGFTRDKDFFEEKKFDTCRNERPLPFDFYLPDYRCLIEYQGKPHYHYTEYHHRTPEGFAYKQENDRIKKEWCEKEGYLLLRIPYTVDRLDLIAKGLIERLNL